MSDQYDSQSENTTRSCTFSETTAHASTPSTPASASEAIAAAPAPAPDGLAPASAHPDKDLSLYVLSDEEAEAEALIFASETGLSTLELAEYLKLSENETRALLEKLYERLSRQHHAFVLRACNGRWHMYSRESYFEHIKAFVASSLTKKLSQASLEVLSIIAYKQPVTRETIRAVRGVSCDTSINLLKDYGLIKDVGRDKKHNMRQLLGTTPYFLEYFGLASLKDLPPFESFSPSHEEESFIMDKLSSLGERDDALDHAPDDAHADVQADTSTEDPADGASDLQADTSAMSE